MSRQARDGTASRAPCRLFHAAAPSIRAPCGRKSSTRARSGARDTIKVGFDLAVVVDADPAQAPFGKGIGLGGQRLEVGTIEFFEQRATSDAEPSDRALLVEPAQQLGDCRIKIGQTVKTATAQRSNDQDRDLDPRLRGGRLLALSRGRRRRLAVKAVLDDLGVLLAHAFDRRTEGRTTTIGCRRNRG